MNYIVGTPFRSNFGTHTTGDEITEEMARTWPRLESLVNTGRLYRIVEDGDYARLPAHIANKVKTRSQMEAKMAVTPGARPHEKLPQVEEAERLIDAEAKSRVLISKGKLAEIRKAEKGEQRKLEVDEPVEKRLPKKKITEDTMKKRSQEKASDFDPEAIRVMKLEDLKDEARKRDLPVSGNKSEVAQRVIDDEIEKSKK